MHFLVRLRYFGPLFVQAHKIEIEDLQFFGQFDISLVCLATMQFFVF